MSDKVAKMGYVIQPAYYRDFRCIGGACPNSCCVGWQVDWSTEAVEKLKSTECSEQLRELMNTSFIRANGKYIVKMGEKNRCPFLTEDNMCCIQRELGEEYLSDICKIYPRIAFISGENGMRSCYSSCYCVIDTICNDEKSMKLEKYRPSKPVKMNTLVVKNSEEEKKKRPELKYRTEIIEFFYEIIADNSRPVETSIVLAALGAQKLDEYVKKGMYDKLPDVMKALKNQLNDTAMVNKINNINPNENLKFNFIIKLLDTIFSSEFLASFYRDGVIDSDRYHKGVKLFEEIFSDKPFATRNIALNLLLEMQIPFYDCDVGLFDNFSYFAAALATIKFAAPAMALSQKNADRGFKIIASYLSRSFAHNGNKAKAVLNILGEFNCKSPAYLAAIIK